MGTALVLGIILSLNKDIVRTNLWLRICSSSNWRLRLGMNSPLMTSKSIYFNKDQKERKWARHLEAKQQWFYVVSWSQETPSSVGGLKTPFSDLSSSKKKKSFTLPNFQINHPLEGIASANGISGEMVKLPFRDIASYSELSSKPAS